MRNIEEDVFGLVLNLSNNFEILHYLLTFSKGFNFISFFILKLSKLGGNSDNYSWRCFVFFFDLKINCFNNLLFVN